jgi:hypothetical protein
VLHRFKPVEDLVSGLTVLEARALCLGALREWYAEQQRPVLRITLHGDLGLEVLKRLAQEKAVPFDVVAGKEAFLEAQHEAFMRPLLEFVWWLVRIGAAMPGANSGENLVSIFLTESGERLLQKTGDHPLLPGYLRRLKERCRDLPLSVINYFGDGQDCFAHGVRRPAVIVVGLAFEVAVEWVLKGFEGKTAHPLKWKNASEAVTKLKSVLPRLELRDEQRRLASAAADFADHLRVRRNDGAHGKGPQFDDDEEVEELLVSAGRHLEVLYSLSQASFAAQDP